MSDELQVQGTLQGRPFSVAPGTAWQQLAENRSQLLVQADDAIHELTAQAEPCRSARFLTLADTEGMRAYERSIIMLMAKAFQDAAGPALDHISVEFSLSSSLFATVSGDVAVTDDLLARVEARMKEMVRQDIPFIKQSVPLEKARDLFEKENMHHKARLLKYQLRNKVKIYSLDGYIDFLYGFMVPSTGYLSCFALQKYEEGFVLRMPSAAHPDRLADFKPSAKVFREMYDTTMLTRRIGVSNVGSINDAIATGHTTEMVIAAEAQMEKRIGDVADAIAARKGVRFVMIAGPSSSGKTTFSNRLSSQLVACGLRPHAIATDNYFVNRSETPRDANGEYDFESLAAMDVELFNRDMNRLLQGETVEMPEYNFKKGVREYNGNYLTLGEQDVLVIEGIHCLNDAFSYALPAESKYRIYISCLTTLNVDSHNRIHTTDIRLLRRIERDARTRGHSAQATIKMWPSVRRGEESNIFPFQDSADVVFNSSVLFEASLLRPYVEPLLFNIPRDCPEYQEARRLLKFLSFFMPVPADFVPVTSITREFIGGGCYKV